MSKWFNLLWLSFFTAIAGETVFFALIDPQQLYLFGQPVHWSSPEIYSVGFFMFWTLTGATAMLAGLMLKSSVEVNAETRERPLSAMPAMNEADTEIGH